MRRCPKCRGPLAAGKKPRWLSDEVYLPPVRRAKMRWQEVVAVGVLYLAFQALMVIAAVWVVLLFIWWVV